MKFQTNMIHGIPKSMKACKSIQKASSHTMYIFVILAITSLATTGEVS